MPFFTPETPETIKLRDDGADAQPEERDASGIITQAAVQAREPWPDGEYVYLKRTPVAGDIRTINRYVSQAKEPDGYEWAFAAAAVFIVQFEVPDPTGVPVISPFTGTFEEKLVQLESMPNARLVYLADRITAIIIGDVLDPLAARRRGRRKPAA